MTSGRKTLDVAGLGAAGGKVHFSEVGRGLGERTPVQAEALAPDSVLAEEFRFLAIRIAALDEERPLRCVGLVSTAAGEGKTTTALGLSAALSQRPDSRVLLMEADLRKPTVERYLGLSRSPGVLEWLEDGGDTLRVGTVAPPGFSILPAGRRTFGKPDLLCSPRMIQLLTAARQAYDYVVVDCPPLTPVADAAMLQDLLDGFLLVVRSGYSPREAIQQAVRRLKRDRVRGVVLVEQREILPSYYSYGRRAYKYGEEQ